MVVLCWKLMFVRKKSNTELISHKPLKSSGSDSLWNPNPEYISLSSQGCKISSEQTFTGGGGGMKTSIHWQLFVWWLGIGVFLTEKTISQCNRPRGAGPLIQQTLQAWKNTAWDSLANYCRRGDVTSKDFFGLTSCEKWFLTYLLRSLIRIPWWSSFFPPCCPFFFLLLSQH